MSDLDLDLLREWAPASPPSAEVRAHALARLEQQYLPVPRPRVARGFGRRFAVAAVAATVLLAGAVFAIERAIDDRVDDIKTVGVPEDVLGGAEVGAGPVNILVIGSDRRDGSNPEAFGTPAESGPPRSDTMFVLRIDGATVRALWIPRDLMMSTGARFNSAFSDGPQAAIEAVRRELGVTVDHYVEIDFTAFVRSVDELGGMRMYLPAPARDSLSGFRTDQAGCQTLDGDAALAFVRSRHLELLLNGEWSDASPRADLDRNERQQHFLRALATRAKERVGDDPVAAVRLADAIIPALLVDEGLGRAEIMQLVRALIHVDPAALQLATVPVQDAGDGGHLTLVPGAADRALEIFRTPTEPGAGPTPSTTLPRVTTPATAVARPC